MQFLSLVLLQSLVAPTWINTSEPHVQVPAVPQDQCGEDKLCPPGLFCNESSCVCAKGYPRDLVKCNGTNLLALGCVCHF